MGLSRVPGASWPGQGFLSCSRSLSTAHLDWRWNPALQYRWNIFRNIRNAIDQNEGGFDKFSQGTPKMPAPGLHGGMAQASTAEALRTIH